MNNDFSIDFIFSQKKETSNREDQIATCQKKNDRLQQQICDLSKQLTTVLVQVEALKNGSNPFAIGENKTHLFQFVEHVAVTECKSIHNDAA